MIISENKIYPRSNDRETIYLKNVITDPNITVGVFTIYYDVPLPHKPRPAGNRKILFHCLRREVSVHQCQSYAVLAFHLYLPHFL